MRHRGRLLEVLHRAETGPMIEEREFGAKLIAPTAKRLVKEYGIKFEPGAIIPSDDDLADRVFEAAMDMAVEVGMFCQDTSRRILWTRAEYEDGLRHAPREAVLGTGNDTVTVRARKPEDTTPPVFVGGPFGVPVPEDIFVPLMLSYAMESVIDIFDDPTLETVYGYPVKAASPWEVLGGWREAELALEVARRAGRPGMPIGGIETSPTAFAQISAASWGGVRPSDFHHASVVAELKTNYHLLSVVAHMGRIGGHLLGYSDPIYGGFYGGADGTAIGIATALIMINQNYMGTITSSGSAHPFIPSNAIPELLWALSVATQALSRNTHLLTGSLSKAAGGPGTKTVLFENAAFAIAAVVSGLSVPMACMTAGGTNSRHCSGLEAKLAGEVAKAVCGMSRGQADAIVKQLVPLYGPDLKQKPIGRPFEEVYDLRTVRPTPEWQRMYDEVRDRLIGLGVPLDTLM